jgi:2-pyrone-4,6-dicarboxylate lactonase
VRRALPCLRSRRAVPVRGRSHVPDDGDLVDLLAAIAPSDATRQALLVDNPERLYRFPVVLESEPPAQVNSP